MVSVIWTGLEFQFQPKEPPESSHHTASSFRNFRCADANNGRRSFALRSRILAFWQRPKLSDQLNQRFIWINSGSLLYYKQIRKVALAQRPCPQQNIDDSALLSKDLHTPLAWSTKRLQFPLFVSRLFSRLLHFSPKCRRRFDSSLWGVRHNMMKEYLLLLRSSNLILFFSEKKQLVRFGQAQQKAIFTT